RRRVRRPGVTTVPVEPPVPSPAPPAPLAVGIALEARLERRGGILAGVRAVEGAGAGSLWVGGRARRGAGWGGGAGAAARGGRSGDGARAPRGAGRHGRRARAGRAGATRGDPVAAGAGSPRDRLRRGGRGCDPRRREVSGVP